MNIITFAKRNKELVFFGLGLTFFSSFGQTFLISLFVPGFLEDFDISYSLFGSFYSSATLISAFILVWIGSKVDKVSLTRYSFFVAGGLALSTFLLAVSYWLPVLLLGLTGVRLFGQGLCGHTAHTAIARNFVAGRGRALSLVNLGFSLGEALLPLIVTSVIALVGWRLGWLSASFFIILILPTIIALTIKRSPEKTPEKDPRSDKGVKKLEQTIWKRRNVLADYRFYIILPGIVTSPFLLTGLFLYQTQLAAYKDWKFELIATAFIAFAISKSLFSLLSGSLIDRFTARRVFPFFLLPLLSGLFVLGIATHPLAIFLYLFLAGMTEGFGFNIKTSLYAELYGTETLGTIRSMMSMFIVISTAVSPILFGYLLDSGIHFGSIINGAFVLAVVSIISSAFIYRE